MPFRTRDRAVRRVGLVEVDVQDGPATIVDVLQDRAAQQPGRCGFTFLPDGEERAEPLTYGELDARARALAAFLRDAGAAGERALLLYPPGLDFAAAFFACLYAGVVPVPLYPPRLNRPDPRIAAVAQDADARFALTTAEIAGSLRQRFNHAPELARLRWLSTDDVRFDGAPEPGWHPGFDPDAVAYLQYTSGSTSAPKGVMVTHRNVLHNAACIEHVSRLTPDDVSVTWLPPFHDMGLVGGLLQPLFTGYHSVLMPPNAFIQKPIRWLRALSRYGGTHGGGPNMAYDLCVLKTLPEEREGLDLSAWTSAYSGAEPIRRETLDRFADTFEPYGFRREALLPVYGLAEATLIVSGGDKFDLPVYREVDADALRLNHMAGALPGRETRALVGCGRPLLDIRVEIVHPERRTACAPGEVGEIWTASPSVARGYWNRPDETRATFEARLADGDGPFLRTGDLGFVDEDGELYITGRLKDLIIVRGRNHYPQDVEHTVQAAHPMFRPHGGAAFGVDVAGEERLVVVQEIERVHLRGLDGERAAALVRSAVSEAHEIQVHRIVLIPPGRLPVTSSGKIARQVCRAQLLDGQIEALWQWEQELETEPAGTEGGAAAPAGITGESLRAIVRELVARKVRVNARFFDDETPFSDYGIDSIAVAEITQELEDLFGVEIPSCAVWEHPTCAGLARQIGDLLDARRDGEEAR